MLPLVISGLLLVPAAQAAPKWDCRASSEGGWECFQDGVAVPPEPTPPRPMVEAAPTPADQAPASSDTTPTQAITEGVVTRPLSEPETAAATAIAPAEPAPERETPAAAADLRPAPETTGPAEVTTAAQAEATPPDTAATAETAPAATPVVPEPAVGGADEQTSAAETAQTVPRTTHQTEQTEPEAAAVQKTAEAEAPTASQSSTASAIESGETKPPVTAARIDQGLDWNLCGAKRPARGLPVAPASSDDTRIEADAADLYRHENRVDFAGNVQVEQGNERLQADHVSYLKEENILDAAGDVYLEQPGLRVTGSTMHYNLATKQGTAEQAEFRLTDPVARGNASRAELLNEDQSRYSDVSYTTCRPGNSDWLVRADELEIDQASGVGAAHNATLRFKGVPFIYLPYVTFPIDDRRKSGFLPPAIGTSENSGADASIPYYFNIAPQMDATFTPRIMSKRGILLGGEFRYLSENNQGVIKAELLPSDSERAAGENDTRGAFNMLLNGTPAHRWHYDIDLNYVSDNDYIDDLGNSLAVTSVRHQERRGDISYYGNGWSFLGRAQQFQTIDDTIAINDRPYSRLPQLLFNLERPHQALGLTYHLRSEYVQFGHSSDTKVKGQRIDLQPGVSLPLRRPWGFLTPKLSLRHTRYSLEDQAAGLSDNPDRTLPTLSLDSGLYFERVGSWFGNAITHTLEPRLFYLYTPKEDQSDIPDFDTAELDFSFANLFRENRFSGADKVGDANQLTTALTTRGLDSDSGEELFRASIGQIFYFRDRDVQLFSSGAVTQEDSSSLVGEVAAKLSRSWRMQAGLQWNPHASGNETEKGAFGIHYLDQKQRILNLTYRYTNGSIEQTDLSARWPITHQLHAVGRWNYSLLHEKSMETFAGIEYESCCWVSRFVVRDYRSDANAEGNLALFLQLELKGLTSLGDKIDQFLERGILGYHTDD